jgi:CheY-like chemotaxis protein
VSRIAHDRVVLQFADVDVAAAVRETEEAMRPALERAGLAFEARLPEAPAMAHLDTVRVQQIVGNLLSNATKFTPPGGQVTLSLAVDADAVVLEVADTGMGIDREQLEAIFELFVQGATTQRGGGLGIGLSLVRRLTELHGGTVVAASGGPGCGSTFTVRLPRGRASDGTGAARQSHPRIGARRVLIVDDDADNAEASAMLLRLRGHTVATAPTAAMALEATAREHPDIVLLDLGLPDLDGVETCRRMRAAGHTGRIVAVTGWGQPEDRARTREAGFDQHLAKPVDPDEIVRLVETAADGDD